jgi:hypothetical protein
MLAAGLLASAQAARAQTNAPASTDTVHVEVGSPLVDGAVYAPHSARVVKLLVRGDRVDTTAVWTNRLEIGDSAGRRVHRWLTAGWGGPAGGKRVGFELRSTFDARTLALLGHDLRSESGAGWKLAVDGSTVRGLRRTPADTTMRPVELTLPRAGFAAGASDLIPFAMKLREGLVMTLPLWSPPGTEVHDEIWRVTRRGTYAFEGRDVPSWEMEQYGPEDGRLRGRIWFIDDAPYVVRWDLFNEDGSIVRMIGESE